MSQDDSEGLSAFALVHFYSSPTLLPFQRQNQLLADLKNNLKFNEYVPELGAFDQETLYKRQSTEDEEKTLSVSRNCSDFDSPARNRG